jgi:hypothetical protein
MDNDSNSKGYTAKETGILTLRDASLLKLLWIPQHAGVAFFEFHN